MLYIILYATLSSILDSIIYSIPYSIPRAAQFFFLYYLREPPSCIKIFYTTSASLPATLPVLLSTRDHEIRYHELLKIEHLSHRLAETEKTSNRIITSEQKCDTFVRT